MDRESGVTVDEKRDKKYQIRLTQEELKLGKEAALDQRYTNLSDFVRDAVMDKIEMGEENQDFVFE